MGIVNYEKQHRKLWNWLAEHPDKGKADYFEGWPEECIPDNGCFACEEAQERWRDSKAKEYSWDPEAEFAFCGYCPIGGLDATGCFWAWSGLLRNWRDAKALDERTRAARQIAELPWKEATK